MSIQAAPGQKTPESSPTSESTSKHGAAPSTTSSHDSPDSAEGDQVVQTVQPKKKPAFTLPASLGTSSLHDRFQSFLPKMERSSKALVDGDVQSMEEVDEHEQHIVMDLGLGVLEHQSSSEDDTSSDDDSQSEDQSSKDAHTSKRDALDALLGNKSKPKPTIQEVK